jgi:CRISPR-associated protein (TIGR03986 family)
MTEGKIKIWIPNKGFGFIERDGQEDLFFHKTQWKESHESEPIKGTAVSFEEGPGKKGNEAKNVRLLTAKSQVDKQETLFLNPYNFVRNLQQARPKEHVLGDCSPPPHDRYVGLTGCIVCTVKAITPIFISDSHKIKDKNGHKIYQFFEYGKEPALPSSSLRGMLRSVFEALTNSCYPTFANKNFSMHVIPQDALKLVPARVEEVNNKLNLRLLPGTNIADPKDGPKGMQYAAWIRLYDALRFSATSRQNPRTPYAKRPLISLPAGMKHGDPCLVIIQRMEHPPKMSKGRLQGQFDFWNVEYIAKPGTALPKLAPEQKAVNGYLCITNQNIENKHDERIFFGIDKHFVITDKLKTDYEKLIVDYQERHKEIVEQLRSKGLNVDKPILDPKTGSWKSGLSRFIYDKNVYAMLKGTIKSSQLEYIVPVSIPRILYNHSVAELLRQHHLRRCHDLNSLCPACRIFGWVNDKPLEDATHTAYASRVRLSHGKLVSSNGFMPDTTLAILSTPKPTTTSFYLLDKQGEPNPTVNYDTDNAQIRGRKFYRHQGKLVLEEYTGKESDQNRTVHGALKPGAMFEFTLDFENLAPFELGALLFALELEEELFHRLGYAKPLGFGSVKITVKSLKTVDWNDRLSSLDPDAGWSSADKTVLTKMFIDEMKNEYGAKFDDIVGDMRALLSLPPELPIHYPRITRRLDPDHPQFEWFMRNKRRRGEAVALDLASEDKIGLPYLL